MGYSPGLREKELFDWSVDLLPELRALHGRWLQPRLRAVELLRVTRLGLAVLHVVSTDDERCGWIPLDFIDGEHPDEKMFPREWSRERCVQEFLDMDPHAMAMCFGGYLFTVEGWCELVVRYERTAHRIEA